MPGDVSRKRQRDAVKVLRSPQCVCGEKKWSGYPFCLKCFKSLPKQYKPVLYFMVKRRYIRTYEEALEYLIMRSPVRVRTLFPPAA